MARLDCDSRGSCSEYVRSFCFCDVDVGGVIDAVVEVNGVVVIGVSGRSCVENLCRAFDGDLDDDDDDDDPTAAKRPAYSLDLRIASSTSCTGNPSDDISLLSVDAASMSKGLGIDRKMQVNSFNYNN